MIILLLCHPWEPFYSVIPGLDPGIQNDNKADLFDLDCLVKPGNDIRKEFLLTILSTMLLGKRKEQRESLSTMLTTDRVKHVCLGRKPMRNYNTMLHMKLNSAVSAFAVAAAFSVLLPPSNAYGGTSVFCRTVRTKTSSKVILI